MEEKLNAIEEIINELNNTKSNYDNEDVKKLFFKMFQVLGNVNIGAFELIYNYGIRDALTGYQRYIENNKELDDFSKKIILDDIKYMDIIYIERKGSLFLLTMNEKCIGGSSVVISINLKTNSITVNTETSNYLTRECDEDELDYFVNEKFYVKDELCYDYDFTQSDVVKIVTDYSRCECYYDNDGIEIKREIESNKNISIANTINVIRTFIGYYAEEAEDMSEYMKYLSDEEIPEEVKEYLVDKYSDIELEEIDNHIDSLNSVVLKLKLIQKKLIKIHNELGAIIKIAMYIRDDECFSKVKLFYREFNTENESVLVQKNKDVFVPKDGNLYELKTLISHEESLSNYIKYLIEYPPKDDLSKISFQRILKDKEKRS